MQCVKHEDMFKKYYCDSFLFPRINDNAIPLWIQETVNDAPRRRFSSRTGNKKFGDPYTINRYISNFFYVNGKPPSSEYNWRHRPNVVISETGTTYSETTEETNAEECLLDGSQNDITEENMKAEENGEVATGGDVEERWQKSKSRNRGRHRGKKKPNGAANAVD